jgi:hypothetical protein
MIGSNNLNLRDWQQYYIKLDPSYGNLIASILQSIFKNKYSTINSLINTIKKKQTKIVTEEGTIDLLFKFDEVIKLTPRFQITNTVTGEDNKIKNSLSIVCDFIITLNFNNIKGFNNEYIKSVQELLDKLTAINKKILIKYLLKQLTKGNYFVSMDFLEKEIFESKIPFTDYTVQDIFQKFNVTSYNTIYSLLNLNNYDDNNNITSNVKVISIPFTPYHMDTYLSRELQHVYRIKYNIGKGELNTKLLYLNADYPIEDKKTIYDALVLSIYNNYLPNKLDRTCNDDFKFETDDMTQQENKSLEDSSTTEVQDIKDKFERKKMILKILKADKIPKHEIDFLDSIDYEKLHIKNTFVSVLNYLSNPFLSKIINTAQFRFLKQYIITNYGPSIKESIDEETRALIEKKFIEYIQSKNCYFIEFYNNILQNICDLTGEKKFLVDTIIRTSSIFKNFCFTKYLVKQKKTSINNFQTFLKIIGSDFFAFLNDGSEDDMVVVPYLKIKEFLLFLITSEINSTWQKLKDLFEELLKTVKSIVFTANQSGADIRMVMIDSTNYNITVKDRSNVKNFQIKTIEDIEFIFQDKEQEKFKTIVKMLYNLHYKSGFGFDNKKDFNKLIEMYNARCDEYSLYKLKLDQYEEATSSAKGFLAFLKKLFFWIPMAINNHNLLRIMKKNEIVAKKIKLYYTQPVECQKTKVLVGNNSELGNIKEKIMEFINTKDEIDLIKAKRKQEKVKEIQPKKEIKKEEEKKIPLPELDSEELKLFEFINKYLKADKDVMFTRSSNMDEEIIVIYIKDNKSPTLFSNNLKDLNTIDEYSTRYFNIKQLINKRYISQKELIRTTNDNKKICYLTYARQYYQYMNKYR